MSESNWNFYNNDNHNPTVAPFKFPPPSSRQCIVENQHHHRSFFYKLRRRIPRTYYFVMQLIVPLVLLILMAFLFGMALARLEMTGEQQSNDEILKAAFREYSNHTQSRIDIWEAMAETSVACLQEQQHKQVHSESSSSSASPSSAIQSSVQSFLTDMQQYTNLTSLHNDLQTCAFEKGQELFNITHIFEYLLREVQGQISFNWMNCYHPIEEEHQTLSRLFPLVGLNVHNNYDRQFFRYVFRFLDEIEDAMEDALEDHPGLDEEEIVYDTKTLETYVGHATGAESCTVHVAGGALFWFTIMTTIGYGNTAPVTDSGRMLVFTCGFITIIGFLALNNTASKVWKHLFEDLFRRYNLRRLIHGPLSVLFWLIMTILWMLVIALSFKSYRDNRLGGGGQQQEQHFPLKDAYWFSYMTTTTVGLGDIHIAHEEFQVGDMFFVPLIVLMGFNFLGIFAEKGVELYNHWFPEEEGFLDILEEQRLGQNRGVTNVATDADNQDDPTDDDLLADVSHNVEC